jgi:cytochrome c-type biogenesis protein
MENSSCFVVPNHYNTIRDSASRTLRERLNPMLVSNISAFGSTLGSVGLAFVAGLLTVISPCILPILPIVIGRSLKSHRYGPIALVGGLVVSFALLGSFLSVTTGWLTSLISGLRSVTPFILLFLSLLMLFPEWSYRLFSALPLAQACATARIGKWQLPIARIGLWGEFWLGTQLGLFWTPCAGPILGGILTLASAENQPGAAFGMLLVYGLGAGIPMLIFAYGGKALGQKLLALRNHSAILQRLGGMALGLTAIAFLLGWDAQIQLLLAPFFPTMPIT